MLKSERIEEEKAETADAVLEEKQKAFSGISKKSFLLVVALLGLILALAGTLSYLIPQGEYLREENGAIIDGTFVQKGVQGIAIWKILTAPFRVFVSGDALTIIMISVFLLIMSGVFNLLEKTS